MAKHFRLIPGDTKGCEGVMKRGQYADYSVGSICRTSKGWNYRPVGGPTMPAPTKKAALKHLLLSRKRWIGNRSALEGARPRRRRRRR
jgi:hypothetical protein